MKQDGSGGKVVYVYSRRGCHLCEILIEELVPLLRGRAELEIRDVDSRSDWLRNFGRDIPVVEIDGERVCRYELDRSALQAALDGRPTSQPAEG